MVVIVMVIVLGEGEAVGHVLRMDFGAFVAVVVMVVVAVVVMVVVAVVVMVVVAVVVMVVVAVVVMVVVAVVVMAWSSSPCSS